MALGVILYSLISGASGQVVMGTMFDVFEQPCSPSHIHGRLGV